MPAAMQTTGSPLTAADLKQLNTALFILNDLLAKIETAQRAGVPCDQVCMMRQDLYNQAATIKAEYFPTSN